MVDVDILFLIRYNIASVFDEDLDIDSVVCRLLFVREECTGIYIVGSRKSPNCGSPDDAAEWMISPELLAMTFGAPLRGIRK